MKTPKKARRFWNEKYSKEEFIYGNEPNYFFKKELEKLPVGTLLLPGDGEGRNAVHAAQVGWKVDAFDISEKAKSKALSFAAFKEVEISYTISSAQEFEVNKSQYDAIGLIYFHLSSDERRNIHRKLIRGLKPGGYLILEAFSKQQLGKESGGPQDLDMLYDLSELRKDFTDLEIIKAQDTEIELLEGNYHKGMANVIRLIAKNTN